MVENFIKSQEKSDLDKWETSETKAFKPITIENEEKVKSLEEIMKCPINAENANEFVKNYYDDSVNIKDIEDLSGILDDVLSQIEELDEESFDELREKYPKIDNMLCSIEDKLQKIENSPIEDREKLLKDLDQQVKRFKGYLVEAVLKNSLDDKFEEISEVEQQQETADGKTNIDITCKNAKEDFKIGNVEVKRGEDLYIESKMGNKDYILNQMEHMKKQIEGHHNAGNESDNGYKSIIVVSSDYKEISEAKRKEFEDYIKNAGSELVVLDKAANEIDNKVKEAI